MAAGKWQFSLKSLLLVFVVLAVLTAIGRQIRRHYFQLPYHAHVQLSADTSITQAVRALNREAAMFAMPSNLALNISEVEDVLRGQNVPAVGQPETAVMRNQAEIDSVGRTLLARHILPAGAELEMQRSGVATLQIPLGPGRGFRFIVRHPGLRRTADRKTMMNWEWKPSSPLPSSS